MIIKKLELTDFRGFKGKVIIDFPDDLAVFVGINGSGKSSVLDGLTILLGQFIQFMMRIKHHAGFLRIEDININATYTSLNINIESDLISSIGLLDWKVQKYLNQTIPHRFIKDDKLQVLGQRLQLHTKEYYNVNFPIIVYYPTNRTISFESNVPATRFIVPQMETYYDTFNKNMNFQNFTVWFIEQTNIENQIKVSQKNFDATNSKLEAIRNALTLFLQNFPYATFKNPRVGISKMSAKKSQKQTLLIDKNDEELELSQLSDGEKGALLLVFDIAYRLSIANPSLENPLQGKGVVMIDEIDLHLHPSWQKSIIKCLQATFPNLQFIVTTHSPLVINHVKKENIFLLENNTCTPLKNKLPQLNTYGAEVKEILKVVQQTPELLPQDVAKKLNLYFDLIDNNEIEEAKKLQKDLKKLIDPQHPELLKGQTFIDFKLIEGL